MRHDVEFALGQVVRSKAGRDAGRLFVVLALLDDPYVLIADGDLRKVAKPKKKKRVHLLWAGDAIPALQKQLCEGAPVFDHEIRAALEGIRPIEEGCRCRSPM